MELLFLFLTTLLGWSYAQSDRTSDNVVDVTGETVKQVETLLAKDPKLPRLTRGEIISLIHEVRNMSATRGDKSLMVVLPYNGTDNSQLEELYTKQPIIKFEGESTTTKRPKRRRKKPTQPRPVYVHSTEFGSATSATQPPRPATEPPLIVFTTARPQAFQTQQPYREDLFLPDQMKETLVEISVNPQPEAPMIFVTPQVSVKPTAPPLPSDVKNTADALTPDLKQVLNSIGIFGEKTTEKPTFQLKAMSPSIDPTTFSRFKPLPTGTEVSDDMKQFLKSFGLLEPSRKKKAMREPPKHDDSFINVDILTDDMKDILKNIGLMDRQAKKVHVFNPQVESSKLNQTEHMLKINRILKKLREIADGNTENISQEELKELLALESPNEPGKTLLDSEIDPALLDEYQSLESIKNEVKRQQPNVTAEASASAGSEGSEATASASSSASADSGASTDEGPDAGSITTTEGTTAAAQDSASDASESTDPSASAATDATERTPSLDDLADSFGGEVSTRRPNGFYFMLDWNSFLDVGLDDRKISLNFSPKVGDPKNFLPVTFP